MARRRENNLSVQVTDRWLTPECRSAPTTALTREHPHTGRYSVMVRMLRHLRTARPPSVTVRVRFALAQAAQWTSALAPCCCTRAASRGALGFRDDAVPQPASV